MLKEITQKLVEDVMTRLPGVNFLLSPSSNLSQDAFSDLPKLVFQGPEITNKFIDYTPRDTEIGEVNNVKVYAKRLSQIEIDLLFRLRYFNNSLMKSLTQLEDLEDLGISLTEIEYDGVKYDTDIGLEWTSDTVPNFSDLKHFESECRIKKIVIEKTNADLEVRELKEWIILPFYKINGG